MKGTERAEEYMSMPMRHISNNGVEKGKRDMLLLFLPVFDSGNEWFFL
jgi:hypothetical protein